MTDPDTLDFHAAAEAAGVHYDTFRKVWRRWSDPRDPLYVAFPPPFRSPPPGRRGTYAWRASAIADWKQARERALGARFAPPGGRAVLSETAEADAAASRGNPAIRHQRAELARLMERA